MVESERERFFGDIKPVLSDLIEAEVESVVEIIISPKRGHVRFVVHGDKEDLDQIEKILAHRISPLYIH